MIALHNVNSNVKPNVGLMRKNKKYHFSLLDFICSCRKYLEVFLKRICGFYSKGFKVTGSRALIRDGRVKQTFDLTSFEFTINLDITLHQVLTDFIFNEMHA